MSRDDAIRVVIDTNLYISFLLKGDSVPGAVVRHCLKNDTILISPALQKELYLKLIMSKFDHYVSQEIRPEFFEALMDVVTVLEPESKLSVATDEADNRLLELAVEGRADAIITGDRDLLVHHPYHNVEILRARVFHERYIYEQDMEH